MSPLPLVILKMAHPISSTVRLTDTSYFIHTVRLTDNNSIMFWSVFRLMLLWWCWRENAKSTNDFHKLPTGVEDTCVVVHWLPVTNTECFDKKLNSSVEKYEYISQVCKSWEFVHWMIHLSTAMIFSGSTTHDAAGTNSKKQWIHTTIYFSFPQRTGLKINFS